MPPRRPTAHNFLRIWAKVRLNIFWGVGAAGIVEERHGKKGVGSPRWGGEERPSSYWVDTFRPDCVNIWTWDRIRRLLLWMPCRIQTSFRKSQLATRKSKLQVKYLCISVSLSSPCIAGRFWQGAQSVTECSPCHPPFLKVTPDWPPLPLQFSVSFFSVSQIATIDLTFRRYLPSTPLFLAIYLVLPLPGTCCRDSFNWI